MAEKQKKRWGLFSPSEIRRSYAVRGAVGNCVLD